MNKIITIFLYPLFLIFSTISTSVGQDFRPYQWTQERTITSLNDQPGDYELYYIQITEDYQFVYDTDEINLFCYVTNHHIIRVNNDEAINKSNRVYISMDNTVELTDLKARVITKDNRVINFDEENIKELESDETGYKIFAIEGAEIGSEIEYYYTRKINSSDFITRVFQYPYPVLNYSFSLSCPENLEYDFKLYNFKGQILQTDTTDSFNHYEYTAADIPAIHSENFSATESNKGRIEVKLAYNTQKSKSRLYTWGEAGKRIYEMFYSIDREEQKAFNDFIKEFDTNGDPLDVFMKIEHQIKTNYFLEEEAGPSGKELTSIFKNKYATSDGFTKLFATILNHLGIEHEIVLVSNRFTKAFDPDFDTWNFLDEYLIYLTITGQYLSPKDMPFRLGTIPYKYLHSYGLFVRREPIQDFIYPVAHTSKLPQVSFAENFDNMEMDVSFSEALDKNTVQLIRSYKGYTANYYKSALLSIDEEDKKEMLDNTMKYLAPDAEIEKIVVSEANTDYNVWNKPFTVQGTFTTKSYIESAGDIILFKIGELIGPQSELYQEQERTREIVNEFNRGYLRKLKIHLPEGFTIQNPEDLIVKKQVFDRDTLIFNFQSNYSLSGPLLEIEITEFYDRLTYPADKFKSFRTVINAAADWNKIVLVLTQ